MKTPQQLRADFWAEDAAQGGEIRSQYETIKRVLAEQDTQWVEQQYEALKRHAIAHTQFYRGFDPADAFPVMNKQLLMSNQARISAAGGYLEPVHVSSTSGSTGTPFSVAQDRRKRKRTLAELQVFGELCDYPPRERMVFFRVFNEKLHRTAEQEARENIFYVDSSCLDDAHLQMMYDVIAEKQPRIIFSYSSTLVTLGRYIQRAHNGASFPYLRSVLCGGEGIMPGDRQMLADVFGAAVYRRYSDMELGILGQDRGDGGAYTLNWGSYRFECLRLDSDEPAADGQLGRIVVTDLFNYAFPMIRYDTGDLGVMERPGDGFAYFSQISGRSRDFVYATDGGLISPASVSVMMWGHRQIRQWQFIQQGEKQYTLRLNADREAGYGQLLAKLKSRLGTDAQIALEFVDEIPVEASNKRRAVICNYQKGK